MALSAMWYPYWFSRMGTKIYVSHLTQNPPSLLYHSSFFLLSDRIIHMLHGLSKISVAWGVPFNSMMLIRHVKFGTVAALIVILGYIRVTNGIKFLYQHLRSVIIKAKTWLLNKEKVDKITELDCISDLKIHVNTRRIPFICNLQLFSVCLSYESFVYWILLKSFISSPYSC